MEQKKLLRLILHLLALPAETAAQLEQQCDSPDQLPALLPPQLSAEGIGDFDDCCQQAAAILQSLSAADSILCYGDQHYPPLLREIDKPPYLLYVRGDQLILSNCFCTVVGSRRVSQYELQQAYLLGMGLARAKLVLVSGFAYGIDGAVMAGHTDGGGKTVAVLGCGLDWDYPMRHRKLRQQIIANGGCCLTTHNPGQPPLPQHFPRRNRILSALTMQTVLLGVSGDNSGALITAGYALNQGRNVSLIGYSDSIVPLNEAGAPIFSSSSQWLKNCGVDPGNQHDQRTQGKAQQLVAQLFDELDGKLHRFNCHYYYRNNDR